MAEISKDVRKFDRKVHLAELSRLIQSVLLRWSNLHEVFCFICCSTEVWWQPGSEIIWVLRLLSGYK